MLSVLVRILLLVHVIKFTSMLGSDSDTLLLDATNANISDTAESAPDSMNRVGFYNNDPADWDAQYDTMRMAEMAGMSLK